MYTIIGLGSAGCNVAETFENKEEYLVKLIDHDIEGENCFSLEEQKTPEDYEKNVPDLSNFFADVTKKVILVVGGSGKISGASLHILKQIKNAELNVLYIRPDRELLGSIGKLQENLTFNVFQEYARSGIFKNTFLVNNEDVAQIIGDVPILQFYNKINLVIHNSLINYLKSELQNPLIDNSTPPKEISRIVTFGVYDLENDVERLFFPLDFIDDKCYNFAIKEDDLKSNGRLFKLIKDRMKQKLVGNTKVSYKIFSTNFEQNYCYVVAYSRKVQE
jgi:hypothetical protein